ncbi:MAG TPA: hypothetical protein VG478_01430 [Acidimicrobiales bacterium]|jgi:hypothetical protein|nr:hypothetical protein [Acidimicrobiales bacterium]
MAPHPGAMDCEAIGTGFLAQPVNALSSLAYVGAALWVVAAARRVRGRVTADVATVAGLVAAEGLGSLLFHGPGDAASHWLHDVTLVGALTSVVATDTALATDRDPGAAVVPTWVLTAGAAGLLAVAPGATNAVAAVAGGAALTAAVFAGIRRRAGRRWRVASAVCLGTGVVLDLLGRTDGAWCRPESSWQPHAGWHVLTATAFALWARAAVVESVRPEPAAEVAAPAA